MGKREPVDESKSTERVVPVIAERLVIDKRQVESGRVRITKHVDEHEQVVDAPGFTEDVEVERVPMDRVLEAPAEVRYEGDTLVVPIMEEVVVMQKRLVLKEELRITKRRQEVHNPQQVTLRKEEVEVRRLDAEQGDGESHNTP